jgi:hypothetical protein
MANLGLRFLLELGALAALAAWGFHTGDSLGADLLLGVGAPAAAAVAWGAFVAPRARFPVPLGVRAVVELLVFGSATAALWAAGWETLAVVYAVAVLASEALLHGLGDPQERAA